MRDFLWSNKDAKMGFHWVKWDDVCHPKQEGGLGIRLLCDINKAFKAKWLCRFEKEDNTLWKNVVKMKMLIGLDGGARRVLTLMV